MLVVTHRYPYDFTYPLQTDQNQGNGEIERNTHAPPRRALVDIQWTRWTVCDGDFDVAEMEGISSYSCSRK
jgi:hypothetical protein